MILKIAKEKKRKTTNYCNTDIGIIQKIANK